MTPPRTPPPRLVVIGFGSAGKRFVDHVLAHSPDGAGRLTVIGAERYAGYHRPELSDLVAGRRRVAEVRTGDVEDYLRRGVDVRLGVHALRIELPAGGVEGTVRLSDGDRLPFDRLLLATGAEPVIPALAGLPLDATPAGCHTLRTLDDARELVAAAGNARRAVVLGGGPLGIETACGLAGRGLGVDLVHTGRHLLDQPAVDRAVRRHGVRLHPGAPATAVESRFGRLTGVRLADRALPADLLVLACGARPRTGLAAAAGLPVRRGVLVDDTLTTADPRVLALGDCAEHPDGLVTGQVAAAWEQARVVADRLTGADPHARYRSDPYADPHADPHADPDPIRLNLAAPAALTAGSTAPGGTR